MSKDIDEEDEMKKIIYIVVIVVMCFICCSNANAMSGRLDKIDMIYKTYNTNGTNTYTRNSSYRLFIDDKLTYCITPGVLFKEGEGYYESNNYNGISEDDINKMKLISYYGYGFKSHDSIEYYLATQDLIHNVLGYSTKYNDGTYNVDNYKQNIINLVNRHNINPDIDDDIYVIPDTEEYFVDSNSSLGEFEIEHSSNITYGIDANRLVVRLMDDNDGYIKFYKGNDKETKYYLKDGAQTTATFGIKKELRKTIRVHKADVGKIDVYDLNRATFEPIYGTKYSLLDSNFNVLETKTTDKNGHLTFDNYYNYDTYYVEEISVIGYQKNQDKFMIQLDSDLSTARFFHGNMGSITIKNIDKYGNVLNGTFEIKNEYGNETDGIDLYTGNYYIRQLSAEENYLYDDITYNISITKEKLYQELLVINYLKDGSITIKNIDDAGNVLKGTFEVSNNDKTFTDLKKLEPGKYYIKQLTAHKGYYIDNNIYEVEITRKNLNQEITIVNKLIKGSIEVKIVGEDNKELNSEYIIYDKDKNKVGNTMLLPGKYYIEQTKTEDGYYIDEKTYEIEITLEDLNKELTIINNKIVPIIPKTSSNDYSVIFPILIIMIGFVFKRIKYSQ